MALAKTLRPGAVVVERIVTLPATSGTTVGPTIPAGTVVLGAGIQVLQAVPDISAYTLNLTDGTTTFASSLNIDAAAANTIRAGYTAGLIATQDTVDAVTSITGSPGTIRARIFAICVDVGEQVKAADEVDRDMLA